MMLLRAVDLQKSYGRHSVLQGVTLTVSAADRIGLVGSNGSGKSTLLRLLGGEPPDAGAVERLSHFVTALLPQELANCESTVWEAAMQGAAETLALKARWLQLAEAISHSPKNMDLVAQYGSTQDAIERADGFNLESRVRRTLAGLGLPEPLWQAPVPRLSGGERTRLNLVRVLIAGSDLLLLDEPTNHLDVLAIEWLETFLSSFRGAVIVASHDRQFLNRIVTRIVYLENGRTREYRGNYDAYRNVYLRELTARADAYSRYCQEVERLREFARRQLAQAARIHQGPKRGRDHYGRVAKKIARRAHAAHSRVEHLEATAPSRPRTPEQITLRVSAPGRLGPTLVHVRALTKRFGDGVLFADVNLTLNRGDRVGVTGSNGAGKTTLLRLLLGQEQPSSGEIVVSPSVSPAMLAQQNEPPADGRRVLDVALDLGLPLAEARALLAALLFRGDKVFQQISGLSGGEVTRLMLLDLLACDRNLLLLDEPTNHLDLESRERLEQALDAYAGTLVVASHDRFLLDRLCTTIWAIEAGRVRVFDGNYSSFRSSRRD